MGGGGYSPDPPGYATVHDNDMFFLLIYNSSSSNRGDSRLQKPRGQLTVSLTKLIPYFNCFFYFT